MEAAIDVRPGMPTLVKPNARLHALDGWRAVAVLLVILAHIRNFSAVSASLPKLVASLGSFGRLGVDVFFVISGYVICSVLLQEYEQNGRISLTAFYIKRCFRILPPLWCFLLVVALLSRTIETPLTDVIKAAVFVCNVPAANCHWGVSHTWTLAYEEQFYILFPVTLAVLLPRIRRLFFAFFAVLLLLIVMSHLLNHGLIARSLQVVQHFITGAGLALFAGEIKSYLAKVRPVVVYVTVIAIFVIYYSPAIAVVKAVKIILVPPLIAGCLFYTSHFSCAAKDLLSAPAIRGAGRISYGIYLWQQLATGYYRGAGPLFYGCALCAMVVICLVSFFYLERPLIRLAARLSQAQIKKELCGKFAPGKAVLAGEEAPG